MFRKELERDLREVFKMPHARLCGVDDETNVIYFNPEEIVSDPVVGSGKTHFRVYGTLGINMDAANGEFGYLHHTLLTSNVDNRTRFQLQGDERASAQTLYEQHRIISQVPCVWEAEIDWNQAPAVDGGKIVMEDEDGNEISSSEERLS